MKRVCLLLSLLVACSSNGGGDPQLNGDNGQNADQDQGDVGGDGQASDDSGDQNPGDDAPPHDRFVYVSGRGGLQRFRFNVTTATLTLESTTPAGSNPSFLTISKKHVVYVSDEDGHVARAFTMGLDGALTALGENRDTAGGTAHIGLDRSESYLFVANYGEGTVRVWHLADNGSIEATPQSLFAGNNAHQMVEGPFNHIVYVPCLGDDKVATFTFDGGTLAAQASVDLAGDAGPRHIAFHATRPLAYVLNELDSTVVGFTVTPTGELTMNQTAVSTLPADFSGTNSGAEIQIAPSGNFVYTSNRGRNSVAIFRINANGTLSFMSDELTRGVKPRHFSIDPAGRWLFVANQDSDNVSVFSVDAATGSLTYRTTTTVGDEPQLVMLVPEL